MSRWISGSCQRRLAADVVEAAIERRQILGMPLQDLVVDGDGAYHARQPAAPGAAQAEQAHDVARIGVEGQVGAGLVAAHVDIAVAAAVVIDVTQQVSFGILGHGVAEIEAHGPEDHADLGIGIVRGVEAAQHVEAAAVDDLVLPLAQQRAERRQREVVPGERCERQAASRD